MQRKVVITGGKGGLGKALTEAFSMEDWQVLSPGRDELDVASAVSVENYFAQYGDVDLLICNAGKSFDQLLIKMSEHEWDEAMAVNLKGAYLCAKAASRSMLRKRNGHVVFISSYSALHPPMGQANYAAAKAGLIGMAKSLAAEWGKRNVRVNVVVPGFLETSMTEGLSEKVIASAREKHMLESFNSPECVAGFIKYIEESMPHTSGQVFNLDSRIV